MCTYVLRAFVFVVHYVQELYIHTEHSCGDRSTLSVAPGEGYPDLCQTWPACPSVEFGAHCCLLSDLQRLVPLLPHSWSYLCSGCE